MGARGCGGQGCRPGLRGSPPAAASPDTAPPESSGSYRAFGGRLQGCPAGASAGDVGGAAVVRERPADSMSLTATVSPAVDSQLRSWRRGATVSDATDHGDHAVRPSRLRSSTASRTARRARRASPGGRCPPKDPPTARGRPRATPAPPPEPSAAEPRRPPRDPLPSRLSPPESRRRPRRGRQHHREQLHRPRRRREPDTTATGQVR